MIVRCGACRSQFDVPGTGQFSCPACGAVNSVAARPGAGAGGAGGPGTTGGMPGGMPGTAPPPPPPPDPPSPRINCPDCDFSFIVGQIEVATCPNCGAEVNTGWTDPQGGQ